MQDFIGVYDCKIDSKGRLMVPAPLKRQLESLESKSFVIKRSVFSPCLELYSMEEWKKQMQMVGKLNRFIQKNNDFVRLFYAGVKHVETDTTGRLLLAKDLLAYSGITKEVVMASAGAIIEIWDKAKYEDVINNPNTDFATLAEEVMGSIDVSED